MPVMLDTGPNVPENGFEIIAGPQYDVERSVNNDLYNFLSNMFLNTSAVDYQRSLELLGRENNFSATQAEINRQFQERMSNTAYQRQAEDLRLAGFNPALILGSGGATTPSGSSASSSSVDIPNLLTSLSSAFSSIYTNAITNATTERGQDISAEVTKRGQDMKLIGDVLNTIGDIVGKSIIGKKK